jgi:transcription elongation factor GreA
MSANSRVTMMITAEGYDARCRELEALRTQERRRLAERLAEARQDGDLADNPALHELFEEHELLERRITTLEAHLGGAEIVAPATDGRAGIGSIVRVREGREGATFDYELVGPLESDAANGRVSITAPVGQALIGQRAGDRVVVSAPSGLRTLEVVDVGPGAGTRRAA